MSLRQEEEIRAAIARVFSNENEGGLCCTIETVNADGKDVSIQVMQDSINISPYLYADDPVTRLQLNGVLDELDDEPEFETVDWDANAFATVGIGAMDMDDVAELVDLVFVKVLACDDAAYAVKATTEDLG
jgi:hypothetical protein